MLCYADESQDEADGRGSVRYEAQVQGRCDQPDDHHEGQDSADEEQGKARDYQLQRCFHLMATLVNHVSILPVIAVKTSKCRNPNDKGTPMTKRQDYSSFDI